MPPPHAEGLGCSSSSSRARVKVYLRRAVSPVNSSMCSRFRCEVGCELCHGRWIVDSGDGDNNDDKRQQ